MQMVRHPVDTTGMLPNQRDAAADELPAHAALRELSAARTVLVVDDEPGIRELLGVILEVEGHCVLKAECGPDALELVAAHPVDLITLDVMMPGMDGWQVADLLDADSRTVGIPRVMVSGLPLGELRAAPGARRAAAVLTKPFDFAQITDLVTELLAPPLLVPHQRQPAARELAG